MTHQRIAFIDHDLNNFHADIFEELLRDQLASRGFRLTACTARLAEEGKAWAEKKGVPYVGTIGELAGQVDAAMILAPSHPEAHLSMVEEAVALGVPLYVDKTFAPDLATARKIFAVGDVAGVPIESSSALRYTDEVPALLQELAGESILRVQTWGGGRSYEEYAIHPLEWAISIMGAGATALKVVQTGNLHSLSLEYPGNRRADVHVFPNDKTPFRAMISTASRTDCLELKSPIFLNTLAAILDFFATGQSRIDRRETLAIRRILDLAPQAGQEGIGLDSDAF